MVEKVTIAQNKETGLRYFLVGETMVIDKLGALSGEDAYLLKDVDDGCLIAVNQTVFKNDFEVIFTNEQQYSHL